MEENGDQDKREEDIEDEGDNLKVDDEEGDRNGALTMRVSPHRTIKKEIQKSSAEKYNQDFGFNFEQ